MKKLMGRLMMLIFRSKDKFLAGIGLAFMVLWIVSILLIVLTNAEMNVLVLAIIMGPVGIFLYWYSFYTLIPQSLNKKRPFLSYLTRVFLVLIVSILPTGFVSFSLIADDEAAFTVLLLNLIVHILITIPLSWFLFKHHLKGNEELYDLRKELGQSNANLDFLRSQINPHFLFNALNTIYGTAIHENADKTSESIGKLGEMMHFMLSENLQETIPLQREIEYLENYISLHRLRTDTHPNIHIVTEISKTGNNLVIAPMLLIPFVENAYKHGISYREPSQINITLEVKDSTVYFDVYNSKHKRNQNDPEKHKGGIGMTNVKQRLELLYPNTYDLSIRETGIGFFVHLTMKLTKEKLTNKNAVDN